MGFRELIADLKLSYPSVEEQQLLEGNEGHQVPLSTLGSSYPKPGLGFRVQGLGFRV